jgi:invasion protein IalB
MIKVLRALLLVFLWCIAPSWAFGQAAKDAGKQAPKEAPAPVGAAPERTTASFGDWVLRCEMGGTPARRLCEVAELITLQGQTSPTAQLALGKQGSHEGKWLTVVLASNIAITTKPQALIAKAGAAPIELSWQRCLSGACFASAPVSEETIGLLSAQSEPGRIVFKDAAERDVTLPLSFRGLAQALAALAKEP